jgi:hypothetical protein
MSDNKTGKPASRTGRYLKYAIGEILLVMVGILLALQVNNWNEGRKFNKELETIYTRVLKDIDRDLKNMESQLEFHNRRKFVFEKVIQDSADLVLLNHGLSRIIATGIDRQYSKTGVNQLRSLNTTDSLSIRISNVYEGILNSLEILEGILKEENGITVRMFRDNTDWYIEWITKEINATNSSPELQEYFLNSKEYKHRVGYMYNLIYNNYIPTLERFIKALRGIRSKLEIRLND